MKDVNLVRECGKEELEKNVGEKKVKRGKETKGEML